MKNFKRSKKALSPVVASIILIAVTVAVSIAVAAWMGALTIGFMGTEELKITSMTFSADTITVVANNTGTTSVTINEVWVNNVAYTADTTFSPTSGTAAANTGLVVAIDYADPGLEEGSNYQVKLVSSKGNAFMYTASAPTA